MNVDRELVDMYGRYFREKRKNFPDKAPSFAHDRFGFADEWLRNVLTLFLAMPEDYVYLHRRHIIDLAERLREKKNYHFFLDALKAIEKRFVLPFPLYLYELKEDRPTIASFLMTELLLVWSLTEKDGKLLVCVQDGFQRKQFPLPQDPYLRRKAIVSIGHNVLALLPFMTQKNMDLLPDKFGPLDGIDSSIELPVFDYAVSEVMNDARARQRYAMDPEGALVRWTKSSYDLQETLVKEVNGVLIGRAQTPQGGALAFINLETGMALDFVMHKSVIQNPLALALASAFHKLVTAKELRAGKEVRLGMSPGLASPDLTPDAPTVVYIPRTIQIQQPGADRLQPALLRHPIFRDSPRDHARRLKKGVMSLEQRKRVEEFERRTGKTVLKWLQPGCTYALPHDWQTKKRDVIYKAPAFAPALG